MVFTNFYAKKKKKGFFNFKKKRYSENLTLMYVYQYFFGIVESYHMDTGRPQESCKFSFMFSYSFQDLIKVKAKLFFCLNYLKPLLGL